MSGGQTMRAVRCVEREVRVVDVERPSGDGVRVHVRACGICGSDLHMLDLEMLSVIPGHEFAGVLDDGTPVAIEPLDPCGACDVCRSGRYNLCPRGTEMIFGVGRDGGMAQEVIVPERSLVPLPRGLEPASAFLCEPLAVALHGLRRVGLRGDERVVVIGGGAIGQCAVACAVAAGCETALVARHDHQRACGEKLGAVGVEGTYDVVIDAAGTSSAAEQAVGLARPAGRMLLLGTYWGGMELPGFELAMKEVDVVPANIYGQLGVSRDFDAAAVLLGARPAIADAIITHRMPLEAAAEAFRTARDRSAGSIKVVLEP